MKKITLIFLISGIFLNSFIVKAQVPVRCAHVVFVLEENYSYSEIIGGSYSSYAPTINALSKASTTVNFTQDFAITHPSEPNYLELFSGSNQGVTVDESGPDAVAPFNDCNLGSSLIAAKFTFIGYSESQPSTGWFSGDKSTYYTKHCPWINWMNGDNGAIATMDSIPVKSDLPFAPVGTYFPDSNHYSTLPTVSWVIPDIDDDMHDPSTPSTAISNGDSWLKKNIMPLVRWAEKPINNTLVIIVWDEDDECTGCTNNIPLLFCSGMVSGQNCSFKMNHYNLLKTIEDMYSLPACGSSSGLADVPTSIWNPTAISSLNAPVADLNVWPVPAKEELNMNVKSVTEDKVTISLYDITGRTVKVMESELKGGDNYLAISVEDISNGVYFLKITGDNINICKKVVVNK